MRSLIILLLAVLVVSSTGTAQKKHPVEHSPKIGQYAVVRFSVSPDTVGVGDSASVRYAVFLDCVSKIVRIDTVFNLRSRPRKATVTVFGTLWSGPGPRPACASMMKEMSLTLHLPAAGTWVIETPKYRNQTPALRDTVYVKQRSGKRK